jgi:drug/metabolite transporter (DMT)-like permease
MAGYRRRQIILLEEQTILSRERTMQQYMTTGLSFIGVGLVVLKLFMGDVYALVGSVLVAIGFWQLYQAYLRFRKYRGLARRLRRKEQKLGLEVGE